MTGQTQLAQPMTADQQPDPVSLADIEAAHARIADAVHDTPVLTSRLLDAHTRSTLFFKGEHLQRAGAFKARGASNAVLGLPEAEAARGVAGADASTRGRVIGSLLAGDIADDEAAITTAIVRCICFCCGLPSGAG